MKVKTEIDIRVNIDREELAEIIKRHVTENVKTYGPGEFRIDLGYSYSGVTARFVQAEEEMEPAPIPVPQALPPLAAEFKDFSDSLQDGRFEAAAKGLAGLNSDPEQVDF